MSKKDYESAARIAQEVADENQRRIVVDAFAELFMRDDNHRFDLQRFRRACEPGRNVKARS